MGDAFATLSSINRKTETTTTTTEKTHFTKTDVTETVTRQTVETQNRFVCADFPAPVKSTPLVSSAAKLHIKVEEVIKRMPSISNHVVSFATSAPRQSLSALQILHVKNMIEDLNTRMISLSEEVLSQEKQQKVRSSKQPHTTSSTYHEKTMEEVRTQFEQTQEGYVSYEQRSSQIHHKMENEYQVAERQYQAAVKKVDSFDQEGVAQALEEYHDAFNAYFALCARMVRLANESAREIYVAMKERTDKIELLTTLLGKLNALPPNTQEVDWENDNQMRALLDAARSMGVEIKGYKFTKEERDLLKENIKMRKNNMDDQTQIERVNLQRAYHQLETGYKQWSEALALWANIMRTLSNNMRAH
jgi:hypothetical protein